MKRLIASLVFPVLLAACGAEPGPEQSAETAVPESDIVAFTNANIWDGTDNGVLRNAHLLVRDGRVESIATGNLPEGATVIDLQGSWVTPGFVNAHGHVSGLWADDSVAGDVERVRGSLRLYAKYGITTVNSLGDSADQGVLDGSRAERESPTLDYARAYLAGTVVAGVTEDEARGTALANVALGVDSMKLRIDDNLGSQPKMSWDAAQAAIDVAKENDLPVATHIFYMDDAAMVLGMGSDLIAHSVRDQPVSDQFVKTMLESDACYVPTLVREVSTFVYAERPDFFDDPFFLKAAHAGELARVSEPDYMTRIANSDSAAAYEKALPLAQDNLRVLAGSGVRIAFGTDSGPGGRFPGYFEHLEFDLMAEAGLSPREILLSATSVAAQCLGLEDIGSLEPGKWADFVVMTDDPTLDIGATRTLSAVYVAGNRVAND